MSKTAKVFPLETDDPDVALNDRVLMMQKTKDLVRKNNWVSVIKDDEQKYRVMQEYKNVKFILFPDDTLKMTWDFIILILMFYTVTITPYRVAFIEVDTNEWVVIDYTINALFGLDVVFNCFVAFFHDESLVVNRWKILINYAKSWMLFDIVSSLPFDLMFGNSSFRGLSRLTKLPKLYRLIKLVKLVRLVKVVKNRGKIEKFLQCFSKLSLGMERLVYFLLLFFIACHLIACILYFVATINIDTINNWVFKYGIIDLSTEEKYIASLYWTITTLCTIGYGDIVPANDTERGVVIFAELAGVFFYSYTIGTITSLMGEMDRKKSKLNGKIMVLQEISKKYNISRKFFLKLKSALEYDQTMHNRERNEMVSNLPKKLAAQLKIVMNQNLIDKNKFFEGKQFKFITSVLNALKPLKIRAKEIVYKKGEFTEEIFLIDDGQVVFFEAFKEIEVVYENLYEGDYFGDVEVFLSEIRETSVKSAKPCELFTLSREDLLSNVLFCFDEIKVSMIAEANKRKDFLSQKKEEAISKYLHRSSVESSDYHKAFTLKTSHPSSNAKEYANLRKSLAPVSRAMLEENDDNTIDELQTEIDKLSSLLSGLEEQVYKSVPKPEIFISDV